MNRLLALLITMAIACLCSNLNAQNLKVHQQNKTFQGVANTDITYTGDLSDIENILLKNMSSTEAEAAVSDLKTAYQSMTGISISDSDLDGMMDVDQSNLDTWLDLYNSGFNTLLVRSLIRNIREKL